MEIGNRVSNYFNIDNIKTSFDNKYMYDNVPAEARKIRSNRSYNIFIHMDIFKNLR